VGFGGYDEFNQLLTRVVGEIWALLKVVSAATTKRVDITQNETG
jgi:hypothetical protein